MKKILLFNHKSLLLVLLLSTVGCTDNDFEFNENVSSDTKSIEFAKQSIHFDLTKNSDRSLLKDSNETVIEDEENMKTALLALGASEELLSKLFKIKNEKINLNWNDYIPEYIEINSLKQLKDLGINGQTLKDRTKIDGVNPDGILISGKSILGKVNKGMYDYFGDDKLYLVKSTDPQVINDFNTKYARMVVHTIYNDSNTEQSGSFSYTYEREEGVTYEQSHSVGTNFSMEIKTKINAFFVSEETTFRAELDYNYTNTQGNYTSIKKTQTSTADYKVPKKAYTHIVFLFPVKTAKIRYTLPLTFDGYIATNYKKRVTDPNDGSKRYFISQWFDDAIIKPIYGNDFYTGTVDVEYKDENSPDIIYLEQS